MSFLDRMLGRREPAPQNAATAAPSADEQAIARYRYLLRTAPPDAVEQAHAEAFAQLTPAQRQQVLQELGRDLPASERPQTADPQALARMATRAELRQPGFLERRLGAQPGFGGGVGMGMGGMLAGSLLSSLAGSFIGTAIASQFLGGFEQSHEGLFGGSPADRDAQGDSEASGDAHHADAQNDSGSNDDSQQADATSNDEYASNDQDDGGNDDMGGDDFGGDDFGGGDFDV